MKVRLAQFLENVASRYEFRFVFPGSKWPAFFVLLWNKGGGQKLVDGRKRIGVGKSEGSASCHEQWASPHVVGPPTGEPALDDAIRQPRASSEHYGSLTRSSREASKASRPLWKPRRPPSADCIRLRRDMLSGCTGTRPTDIEGTMRGPGALFLRASSSTPCGGQWGSSLLWHPP